MRERQILIKLIEEIIRESRDSRSPGLSAREDVDMIVTLDKYGIDRVDIPGRNSPLGNVNPLFIKSRKGDQERLMIPTRSQIENHKRMKDMMKSEKDRDERDRISRSMLLTDGEFNQMVEANKLIEPICTTRAINKLFKSFNNQPIKTYTRFDNIFNNVGPERSVPPSFLKAFCLKETTLGLQPTPGYSPRFSISPALFRELQEEIENYKPTYEEIVEQPWIETKVAATLISRGITLIKGGEDIETVLKKYRGIGHEPSYGDVIDELRILVEAIQL